MKLALAALVLQGALSSQPSGAFVPGASRTTSRSTSRHGASGISKNSIGGCEKGKAAAGTASPTHLFLAPNASNYFGERRRRARTAYERRANNSAAAAAVQDRSRRRIESSSTWSKSGSSSSTSLDMALDPTTSIIGPALVIGGVATLFGWGPKRLDEEEKKAREKEEYAKFLQRKAAAAKKPAKVYPKGPKQLEAERSAMAAAEAALAQARAAGVFSDEPLPTRPTGLGEAVPVPLPTPVPVPPPVAAAAAADPNAVAVAPVVAAPVEPTDPPTQPESAVASYLSSPASGASYLDAITEVCEPMGTSRGPTVECAGAITNYLDALSAGVAQPIDAGPGIASYLDTIASSNGDIPAATASAGETSSSSPAVAGYLDAVASGEVASPSAPAVKTFLDTVASGSLPGSGAAIASYLESLDSVSAAPRATGRGVPTYLDSVQSSGGPSISSGSSTGPSSYLDSVGDSGELSFASAVTTYAVAEEVDDGSFSASPAPLAAAAPTAPMPSAPAELIKPDVSTGSVYLNEGSRTGDGDIFSPTFGPKPTSYLDAIAEACEAPAPSSLDDVPAPPTEECTAAMTSYLDALSTGKVQPTAIGAAGISTYLDSINHSFPSVSSVVAVRSYFAYLSSGNAITPTLEAVRSYLADLVARDTNPSSISIRLGGISLDNQAATPMPSTDFVDSILESCGGNEPTDVCAPALGNYLDALSIGATQPSRVASTALSSYLDTISNGASVSGGGPGIKSYTDAVSSTEALSFGGVAETHTKSMAAKNERLVAQVAELQGEKESLEAKSSALRSTLGSINTKLEGALLEKIKAEAHIRDLTVLVSEKEQLESRLVETRRQNEATIARIESLAADNGRLSAEIIEMKGRRQKMEARISELKSALECMSAEKDQAEIELLSLQAAKQTIENRVNELSSSLAIVDNDRQQALAMKDEAETKFLVLTDEITLTNMTLEQALAEKDSAEAHVFELSTGIEEARRLVSELMDERDKLLVSQNEQEQRHNAVVRSWEEKSLQSDVMLEAALEDKGRAEEQINDLVATTSELAALANQKFAELSDRLYFMSQIEVELDDTKAQMSTNAEEIREKIESLQSQILWVGDALSSQIEEAQHCIVGGLQNAGDDEELASSSSPAVAGYLDAVASGEVASPSAPAVKTFLDTVASGSLPGSGAAIASYLESLDFISAAPRATGRGVPTYLDSVQSSEGASFASQGSVRASYLDAIAEACEGNQPMETCAPAISNYLDALSSGAAQPSKMASAGISSYLESISGGIGTSSGGPGMKSYVDVVGSAGALQLSTDADAAPISVLEQSIPSTETTEAVSKYLDVVSSGVAPAPAVSMVKSYLDDVANGAVTVPSTPDALSSYFESATSKSTKTTTTVEDDGTITVRRVTTLVIEDED